MMGNAVASLSSSSSSSSPIRVAERHYVLNTPMVLLNGSDETGWIGEKGEVLDRAVFATGCYWGSEKGFWKFPRVYSTAVGYIGGDVEHPSYERVCSGSTGHTEAVQVFWDPKTLSFVDLMRQFLQSHDPTQVDGQGNDHGTQYRSGVYVTKKEHYELAKAAIGAYEKALGGRRKIATEVKFPSPPFYYAEDYMQQYLAKPGARQYCSAQPREVDLPPFETWAPPEYLASGEYKPRLGENYWAKYAPVEGCVISRPGKKVVDAQIVWNDDDTEGGGKL